MNKAEKAYGSTVRGIMYMVNPIKKKIIKTKCMVHRFINLQAIDILHNDGYLKESDYFRTHIECMNDGVVWADQDFKSSNHFFSIDEQKGLYGFSNALIECQKYYDNATTYHKAGDIKKSMYFLGAACHLVQDSTVPQHANNKLLKNHRQFELWIISKILSEYSYVVTKGVIKYDTLSEYIKNNTQIADETYKKCQHIVNRDERYHIITAAILNQAQRTTAGFLLNFYNEVNNSSKN